MVIHLPLHSRLLSLLFFSLHFSPYSATSNNISLKLPLLHKNPFPPNPSQSLSSVLHRLNNSRSPELPFTSGASFDSGQLFVDLRIGTPPQRLLLVADTGSDLVWVQCSACRNCSNHPPNTAFFPRHSATFTPHHCFDDSCRLVPYPRRTVCNHTRLHSSCRYEYSYSDGSFTSDFFSRETTFNTSSGNAVKPNKLASDNAQLSHSGEDDGGGRNAVDGMLQSGEVSAVMCEFRC